MCRVGAPTVQVYLFQVRKFALPVHVQLSLDNLSILAFCRVPFLPMGSAGLLLGDLIGHLLVKQRAAPWRSKGLTGGVVTGHSRVSGDPYHVASEPECNRKSI